LLTSRCDKNVKIRGGAALKAPQGSRSENADGRIPLKNLLVGQSLPCLVQPYLGASLPPLKTVVLFENVSEGHVLKVPDGTPRNELK
jgi:hypothetical protein